MLQGSLNDFALIEILKLLAETTKSGRLDIDGDRGNGALNFSAGKLASARASNCDGSTSAEDVLFELLRYQEGSFAFTSQEVESKGDEKNVAAVLSVAESRLADWNAIAEVVPTLQHVVRPVLDLPEDEVTINRDEWAALSAMSAGCSVGVVCDELGEGEVEGCRRIKHLIERDLAQIGAAKGPAPALPPSSRMTQQKVLEPTAQTASAGPRPALETLSEATVGSAEIDERSSPPPALSEALKRKSAQQSEPPSPQATEAHSEPAIDDAALLTSPSNGSGADSLVASLRGDSASGVSTLMQENGVEPTTNEGLLMRYLKEQQD